VMCKKLDKSLADRTGRAQNPYIAPFHLLRITHWAPRAIGGVSLGGNGSAQLKINHGAASRCVPHSCSAGKIGLFRLAGACG
jgi:hypothetical protein